MREFKNKILIVLLVGVFCISFMATKVYANTNSKEIQTVKNENGDYLVYVKDLFDGNSFKYALSDNGDMNPEDPTLNYIYSVEDEDNNQVIIIENDFTEGKEIVFLYINNTITKIVLSDALTIDDMKNVETTTKRIDTNIKENIEIKNEIVDGVRIVQKVGGIEITDEERDSYNYEYVCVKLPVSKYSELQELANTLNNDYNNMDMYSKIEFSKRFNSLYQEIINGASWKAVDNYLVKQPIDTKSGDQYIVLLKRITHNRALTYDYDVKFMVSNSNPIKEEITEKKEIKETTKLPITGDTLILFVILAAIVIALIIVGIRMKKLQNKDSK